MSDSKMVVAIGDATNDVLISLGFQPDIQVVDGYEQRIKRSLPKTKFKTQHYADNPAGTISKKALRIILRSIDEDKPVRIIINGEEDLLALIIFAFYPDDSVIFYGQPGEGLVYSKVKNYQRPAKSILEKMGIKDNPLF